MDAIVTAFAGPMVGLGRLLAARLRQLNPDKLVVEVGQSDLPHLDDFVWARAWAWDFVPDSVDRLLYVDADVYPLLPFPPFPDADFAAVLDIPGTRTGELPFLHQQGVPLEDCRRYFNAGVMLSRRASRPLFDEVKQHVHELLTRSLKDQTWFNVLAPKYGLRQRLPRKWNFLVAKWKPITDDVLLLHFANVANEKRFPLLEALFHGASLPASSESFAPGYLTQPGEPWPDGVTFGVLGPRLSEVWSSLRFAVHVRSEQGIQVRLDCSLPACAGTVIALAREAAAEMEGGHTIELVEGHDAGQVVPLQGMCPWRCSIVHAKTRWRGWSGGQRRRVACQMETERAASDSDESLTGIRNFLEESKDIELISVRETMLAGELVKTLSSCDVAVGCNAGLMQIACAVGVPTFLLTQELPDWLMQCDAVHCRNVADFSGAFRRFIEG
jgi:hypothetical protein